LVQHQKSSSRITGALKKRQKCFKATADFSLSAVALLFVYTDAIFDRQNLIQSALLNNVSKTISPAQK
jgi:hypothetical protein